MAGVRELSGASGQSRIQSKAEWERCNPNWQICMSGGRGSFLAKPDPCSAPAVVGASGSPGAETRRSACAGTHMIVSTSG
eukprot:365707-Chlamydomonas_euryale.AAC.4